MTEADVVRAAFKDFGKANDLAKKGASLYLEQVATIGVFNLQRSQWGPHYYVNIALWLRALGEDTRPKEYACHVRTRMDALFSDETEYIHGLLDSGEVADFDQRRGQIVLLLERALGVLRACADLEGLRGSDEGQRLLASSLVTGEAQSLLRGASS